MSKRILLMYISENSGHHHACLALEQALHLLDTGVETRSINSFNYTNPILEKIINKTYMTVIKNRPEVWQYLYDNPTVVKKTQRLKASIHRYNSGKMKTLIDEFNPGSIICTQAFPCGIIADLKRTYNLSLPLIGVLTDYAPHSYWVYNDVDAYIVPAEETGERLIENGVAQQKIKPLGIPVNPKFHMSQNRQELLHKYSLHPEIPVILIMGGGQGLGPIKNMVTLLDKSAAVLQNIVVTGNNRRLYKYFMRARKTFKKNTVVLSFSEEINELMDIASLIITKPGGITTAEAMAKNLPMVIINPIPGQEAMNTKYLLRNKLAVKANDEKDAVVLTEELLSNSEKLSNIRSNIKDHAKSDSSIRIARLVLEMTS